MLHNPFSDSSHLPLLELAKILHKWFSIAVAEFKIGISNPLTSLLGWMDDDGENGEVKNGKEE